MRKEVIAKLNWSWLALLASVTISVHFLMPVISILTCCKSQAQSC